VHSDDIAKVCSKSYCICCGAPFSSRMVFDFKLRHAESIAAFACKNSINVAICKRQTLVRGQTPPEAETLLAFGRRMEAAILPAVLNI